MEAIVAQAIKDSAALKKTDPSWKPDEPQPQPYYDFDPATASWVLKQPSPTDADCSKDSAGITNVALYSW